MAFQTSIGFSSSPSSKSPRGPPSHLAHPCRHLGLPILDTLDLSQATRRHEALLLIGILGARRDHQASNTNIRLVLHILDFSLERSLRASPASISSKMTEWLHEMVRLQLSAVIAQVHCSPTPVLPVPYTPAPMLERIYRRR